MTENKIVADRKFELLISTIAVFIAAVSILIAYTSMKTTRYSSQISATNSRIHGCFAAANYYRGTSENHRVQRNADEILKFTKKADAYFIRGRNINGCLAKSATIDTLLSCIDKKTKDKSVEC